MLGRTIMPTGAVLLALSIARVPSVAAQEAPDPEARIAALGIELPSPYPPIANYVRAVSSGDLVFLGGHGPCELTEADKGKVGRERTVEEGYETARRTAICMLASLKEEIGDLSRVKRIVRVLGMVNAVDDFTRHPEVINGFSDLMVEVFGDRGRHARAAVGMASLPLDLTVEIEMIVEVSGE
jgi:enamine deaminase RidA (YjgF/YER057c/UK114 family)